MILLLQGVDPLSAVILAVLLSLLFFCFVGIYYYIRYTIAYVNVWIYYYIRYSIAYVNVWIY